MNLKSHKWICYIACTYAALVVTWIGFSGTAHGQGETATASAGLYAVTLNLPQGNLTVYLPADLAPGDRISGAITVAPAGEDRKELAFNQAALNGYVLTFAGQQTPATIGWETWTVPSGATSLQFTFTDGSDVVQGQIGVPVQPNAPLAPNTFTFPTDAQAGRPARISGSFDGSLENTRVQITGQNNLPQDAELLAESPRSLVVRTPDHLAGQTVISLSEGVQAASGKSTFPLPSLTSPASSLNAAHKHWLHNLPQNRPPALPYPAQSHLRQPLFLQHLLEYKSPYPLRHPL